MSKHILLAAGVCLTFYQVLKQDKVYDLAYDL